MNPYLALALLLVMALAQTSALPLLLPGSVRPDLILLVVISWSLLRGRGEGGTLALAGGLLLDLLSGGTFGALTVSLFVACMLTSFGESNIVRESPWLPMAASALATVIYYLAYLALLSFSGRSQTWTASLLQVIVPAIVVNVITMLPTYWIMRWLHQRLRAEKMSFAP